MKIKTVTLDAETKVVLLKSKIEGNKLTLLGQLERGLYQKVAKAIEAAGGKWNRVAGCHIFPHDVRESLNIGEDTVAVTNLQQTYQAFYTPREVADELVQLANVSGCTVLEPSAGEGALVEACVRRGAKSIKCIDINPKCCAKLTSEGLVGVVCEDFLKLPLPANKQYERVVMNPPFTRGSDVRHVLHALQFVAPGGRLVAIIADGSKQRDKLNDLVDEWHPLPAGSFLGTNVKTCMIIIQK